MKNEKIFSENPLFSELSETSKRSLQAASHELSIKKGEFLMKEGDEAKEIFLILEGDLEVLKYDRETKAHYVVNVLHPGSTVGEVALIDEGKRSASIRALSNARFLKIPFKEIEKLKDAAKIHHEISKRMSHTVRETTDIAAVALKKQLLEYKERVATGQFLVGVITLLCFVTFSMFPLRNLLMVVSSTSYISIPMIIVLSVGAFALLNSLKFPLEAFGITKKEWKKSLFEGIAFTVPVCAGIVGLKWVAIQFLPPYHGHQIFEPFNMTKSSSISAWLIFQCVYCLFVPLQELMARGGLQGLLQRFLVSKYSSLIAVLVSNIIFASVHIFLSEIVAVIVFVAGLYFGWLYSRAPNLLGVIVAHCIIGVWGLGVVGPVL
jgi:CRP-like cAMP-binding protein/membrane protease YdiL (CAAX protease family)